VKKSGVVVVWITTPNARVSRRLAHTLVAERLAACVNILSGVRSVYRWKGKVENASEHLLIAKTTRARFTALKRRVQSLHPSLVPEIISFSLFHGHSAYLSWVADSVSKK
jgi:periplasmic divalent cation tolerance protein